MNITYNLNVEFNKSKDNIICMPENIRNKLQVTIITSNV